MLNYFKHHKFLSFGFLSLFFIFFAIFLFNIPRTFAESEDPLDEIESEKFVTIFDRDEKKTIKTDAKTVAEVLERLDVELSPSDSTDPKLNEEINANNFFINIHRSRPVIISDGTFSKIVSTSSFEPKSILTSAGLTVYDGDEISLEKNPNFLETGISEVYKIKRNGGRTVTVEEEIPFTEIKEKDYNLEVGKTEVKQLGEVGKKVLVYEVLYIDGVETERELKEEKILREPVSRIIAVGTPKLSMNPLTAAMGRNRYTTTNLSGATVERQETYYDLPMSGVMGFCGKSSYTIREDGAKIDEDGYILVAADLNRYPRCSVVMTSLGEGKVYDTGTFARTNPEQFDLATDWTNRDGR